MQEEGTKDTEALAEATTAPAVDAPGRPGSWNAKG
jgi:hypothetical protein